MIRTVIQSDKSQNKIAKICYAVRYSYHIIRNTGHGNYYENLTSLIVLSLNL